jgi:hypothetical protein
VLVDARFAVEDALLVDIGPAKTEAEALDGGAGLRGDLGEAFGLFGCEGPRGGGGIRDRFRRRCCMAAMTPQPW